MAKSLPIHELQKMAAGKKIIELPLDLVPTPGALDWAKEQGLTISRGGNIMFGQYRNAAKHVPPVEGGGLKIISNDDENYDKVKAIVKTAFDQLIKPVCENPKALHIKAKDIGNVPLNTGKPDDKVYLTEVVSAREANMAAGTMSFDHSILPWYCGYDETNYVLEGEYHLKVGNEEFVAYPGDVLNIPRNSDVVFG